MEQAKYFTDKKSIIRKIWGNSDTVLFIFAGASAEFALNKAVDWLYFTGKLPADPLGRLFSTVTYAKKIVFSTEEDAYRAIDSLRHIHASVEQNRGTTIPDWAYRDVLFMLIWYSITAYELLEKKLTTPEKEEVYNIFYRLGVRMGLTDLPINYREWLPAREAHLDQDLQMSRYTADLFKQYKKHLGAFRFKMLVEAQKLVVPRRVSILLKLDRFSLLTKVLPLYKFCRLIKLDGLIKRLLLPRKYKAEFKALAVTEQTA